MTARIISMATPDCGSSAPVFVWDTRTQRDWLFNKPKPSIGLVVDYISKITGISAADIRGQKRSRKYARARHAAMYIAWRDMELSTPQIGRYFGRDHTSVLYAIDCVEHRPDLYPLGGWE